MKAAAMENCGPFPNQFKLNPQTVSPLIEGEALNL